MVYKAVVLFTMPDNFDKEGATVNVEESLMENPDIDNAEVLEIEEVQ